MYCEIRKSQFSTVTPLLEGVSAYLSLPAVIEGTSSGRVWVDDLIDPGSALVWDLANGFLFVCAKSRSDVDNSEVTKVLKETLKPLARKSGYTELYILFLPEIEETHVDELLRNLPFSTRDIYHFHLSSPSTISTSDIVIPPPFQLVRIDHEILDNDKIINIKEIKRCIKACWNSLEDYFENGVGYLLLTDDTVVSWCSTDYVVSNTCDLYVETFDGYREKGFGTIVASASVKECLYRNYEVDWHCWQYNTGSIRLAEKIGFSRKTIQRVYIMSL